MSLWWLCLQTSYLVPQFIRKWISCSFLVDTGEDTFICLGTYPEAHKLRTKIVSLHNKTNAGSMYSCEITVVFEGRTKKWGSQSLHQVQREEVCSGFRYAVLKFNSMFANWKWWGQELWYRMFESFSLQQKQKYFCSFLFQFHPFDVFILHVSYTFLLMAFLSNSGHCVVKLLRWWSTFCLGGTHITCSIPK